MQPKISVIVPIYNTHRHLRRCLDSIINQNYTNLQILLINDGSTDSSPSICDEYAALDERVTAIHTHNHGVSSARNLGIEMSIGDFVSFIDSDDWIEVDSYEHLIGCILKHHVDAVMFEYSVDYENGRTLKKSNYGIQGIMDKSSAIEATISSLNKFAVTKLYSKHIIGNVRFNEDIHIGEDTLFACSVLRKANNVYFTNKLVYHYVQSVNSSTRCKFNSKRLTGVDAYRGLILLCKESFPNLVTIATSAYVSLIICLIIELLGSIDSNEINKKKAIKAFKKEVDKYVFSLLFSKEIGLRYRINALLCHISPWLPYMLRKRHVILNKLESIS